MSALLAELRKQEKLEPLLCRDAIAMLDHYQDIFRTGESEPRWAAIACNIGHDVNADENESDEDKDEEDKDTLLLLDLEYCVNVISTS